jgi:hypothetical protein
MMTRALAAVLTCVVLSCAATAWAQDSQAAAGSSTAVSRPPKPPAFNPPTAPVQRQPEIALGRVFSPLAPHLPHRGALAVGFDLHQLRANIGLVGSAFIENFPLTSLRFVDLEVERFWVTAPDARFVLGGQGASAGDSPSGFDPQSVVLLRGRVRGFPRSDVYLGLADSLTNGVIDLGPGYGRFGVSSRGHGGEPMPPGQLLVFEARGTGANPIPYCNVIRPDRGEDGPGGGENEPRRGLKQLQLAIETDREFFRLFDDENATMAYIVEMYGAVSHVYMRDINVRVDLTFVRIWPTGNVPFTVGLAGFRNHWINNMQSVPRDVAQMFSGRGDLPGGVAYLNAICNSSAYGFCGNALGYFADVDTSDVYTYDPMVAAHELGHNCGTHHTDTFGIDECHLVSVTPRRGTIMSYCNQSVSGGLGVIDVRFHKLPQGAMLSYLNGRNCVVFDCNQNGIADNLDILNGISQDLNGNGIPDECEDCNGNGILDSIDITIGTSQDVNGNGIPDECEPDCNNNGIPDTHDIFLGTSQDLHGDNIPDECDADLNNNGISDYNEIMLDMTLDKDRDRTLDSVQDCGGMGIPNLQALQGAWNLWTIANQENRIREYTAIAGVLMGAPHASQAGLLDNAQDLIITPDRRIFVSSAGNNSIFEFDRLGQLAGTFVAAGAGGLSYPTAMTLTPWGNLLVCSRGTNSVLEFDIQTGAFVRDFIAAGAGGLITPTAITYGPSGHLYIAGNDNRVREFDGHTGAFTRLFVGAANGSLSGPRGIAFSPLGTLLVTSFNTDQVLEYDGQTGAFLRSLLVTGLPVEGPWSIRIGPLDNLVYVSRYKPFSGETHVTRARIFIFDPRLGNFVRAHVQALDSQLTYPTGFDFMPGDQTDCNKNLLPDSCDIAAGTSLDLNNNGIPDECEGFCYANCDGSTIEPVLNVADFSCFLTKFAAGDPYANCDGSTIEPVLNVADFSCFLTKFAAGCP